MKHLLLFTLVIFISVITAQDEARLLRFPAIYGNKVVFSYAGDLYTVSSSGGVARKITNDNGYEMFPRFSPDGKNIAFTGQYDGNTEVYLIPSDGGIPKRITYTATLNRDDVSDRMGPNNIIMSWRDNETIVFRSRWYEFNDFKGHLFSVNINGSPAEQLPLPRGGFCSFSDDGKKMAYNRVFREFRTWKRYRGGQADDVWIYDFNTKTTTNVTSNPAQDIIPMWKGNKIYFLSDRDNRMNLFSVDLVTRETKKLTDFTEFDIKFPSIGNDAIIFENGGYLYRFDLVSEKAVKIPVYINEDYVYGRKGIVDVSRNISNYEIAPDGSRGLFGARGEVFTVPVKFGNTRNLTNSSGVHERNSKWSPDGKWISYISDKSGEDEIYISPQNGNGEVIQVTNGGDVYKYQPVWSPDSKKLMWSDRMQRLYYTDIDTKKPVLVAESKVFEINDYNWSPDSKWITYSMPEQEVMSKIYLYSVDNKKTIEVTDGWFTSVNPVFSSDGKYLFFVSSRNFSPKYSQTEWNHIYSDMSKIYFVTLTKDTPSPFRPKSDEVTIKENSVKDEKKDDKKDEKKKDETTSVKVDEEGIINRIIEIPAASGNYFSLASVGNKVYYIRGTSTSVSPKLFVFDLTERKETECGEINGFEISADSKKMLISQSGKYAIIDLPQGKIDVKEFLNLSDLKMNLDRYAEWNQIFNESWRQMRDYFYAPNMHGVDWEKIRETYEPLVKHVNHRADLTYIIGEMIGELNAGHAYVGGGDYPQAEKINLGLLGAKLEKDASGFYKILKILKGQNWDPSVRSPLTDAGVDVKEGEYIIKINGNSVKDVTNIYELLVNTAGKQVTLSVNSSADEKGSRESVVIPVSDEHSLYYYTWVQDNIEKVNKASDGKIGYIHIPDMGVAGLNEFVKYYYPQLYKKALIIDVRGNGGGNVSPMIIERLKRELVLIDVARNSVADYNPGGMHVGPKAALLDEFSASDGDIFSYRFKKYKLGKTIGKRSWGGVVGIRGSLPLLDGGYLNKPEFSRFDIEGKEWVMEGVGVEPDIIIDNDPAKEFAGTDEQLDKAVEVLLEELKNNTFNLPDIPPYPDKSK